MQLTDKKLKVSANINMAYVINYLNMFMGYSRCDAFLLFTSSEVYKELADLRSGLCTAIAPELLFMLEDEKQLNISENDSCIEAAFEISPELQYTVNISEAVRYALKLTPEKYSLYKKKKDIWLFAEANYGTLSPLKRDECIKRIINSI